jgi:hypothetical protein
MHPKQAKQSPSLPSYPKLVQFLVEPFLDTPEMLKVDVEQLKGRQRVWVRLAFADQDKGKVFGRGGRNIQAIRTILETAAKEANQSLYLDIYNDKEGSPRKSRNNSRKRSNSSGRQRRSGNSSSKPAPKPRPQ